MCGDNADWFRIDAEAGEILRELQGCATAGLQHSRDVGMDGVQSVAEGKGFGTETADPDEMVVVSHNWEGDRKWIA